jgi:hypothetical protein
MPRKRDKPEVFVSLGLVENGPECGLGLAQRRL